MSTNENKSVSKWSPNEIQNKFMGVLKDNPDGLTLFEVGEVLGVKLSSGSTNTLVKKGLVTAEQVEFECNAVTIEGARKVGTLKKKVMVYKLAVEESTTEESATNENDLED